MSRASEIWQKFVCLPGAVVDGLVGIASEHAIGGVILVIRKFRPRKILELGAGIGTLTYAVAQTVHQENLDQDSDFRFYTIENNDFCLGQLQKNLAPFASLYTVLQSTQSLPKDMSFDCIIVDGGGEFSGDMGEMDFSNILAHKGVIFVEGTRKFQRELIIQWYASRQFLYVKIPSHKKTITSPDGMSVAHNKAYHLFVFEPTIFDALWLKLYARSSDLFARVFQKLRA